MPLGRLHLSGASESAAHYDGHPFSVAGATLKLSVNETWACDEHWEQFSAMLSPGTRVPD